MVSLYPLFLIKLSTAYSFVMLCSRATSGKYVALKVWQRLFWKLIIMP